MSKPFSDLERGDVFSFTNHASRESWEKTGPHRARVVNSDHTRNVAGDEPVNVEYAAADRAARLRPHYHDATGHEDTPCWCPAPGTYAPQGNSQDSTEEGRDD